MTAVGSSFYLAMASFQVRPRVPIVTSTDKTLVGIMRVEQRPEEEMLPVGCSSFDVSSSQIAALTSGVAI